MPHTFSPFASDPKKRSRPPKPTTATTRRSRDSDPGDPVVCCCCGSSVAVWYRVARDGYCVGHRAEAFDAARRQPRHDPGGVR
jgi:hypothetical protein